MNHFKVLCYKPDVWNQTLHQVAWLSAVPQGLFVFLGVCEFLGGIGLVLPAMTGVKPKLTPFAAFGLTLITVLAALFHIMRDGLTNNRPYPMNAATPPSPRRSSPSAYLKGSRFPVRWSSTILLRSGAG